MIPFVVLWILYQPSIHPLDVFSIIWGINYYFFVKYLMKWLACTIWGNKIYQKLFVFKHKNYTQSNELFIPMGNRGLCPAERTGTHIFYLSFMMRLRWNDCENSIVFVNILFISEYFYILLIFIFTTAMYSSPNFLCF